jgi:hypothetical protein
MRHRSSFRIVTLLALAALAAGACARSDAAPADAAGATAAPAPPALPVDSLLPPEEALRRFRDGLPVVTAYAGGAPSRDSLVRLFVGAVERRDTALVNRLIVSRAEFAHLWYPTSPLREPPYGLDPQMTWFQLRTQSEKGIGRVFDRLGGRPLRLAGIDCPTDEQAQGENRVWEGCAVRLRDADGRTRAHRLFGAIVERGGQHKFVGYGNDL